mgnify:CR=1 FL=1
MQQHRIISLASILVMLLIPVLAWFLVAQPQLAAAAEADRQRVEMEAQIAIAEATVAQLKADSARMPQLNADLNDLRTSIPAKVDSSGYIDGLDLLATRAGVEVTGLTVGEALAYVPAEAPASANAVATDAAAAAEADGAEPPAFPGIVTHPLITPDTMAYIPVTVDVTGSFADIMRFVQGVQTSPRLFLVTGLDTGKQEGDKALTATVTGYIYAIPIGVEGKPRPISTTVKIMDPIEPETAASEEDEGADADGGSAEPDPTQTPAP